MQEIDYEKIKAEYEASTDIKLVEWARPYFEGTKKPNNKDRYVVCPVSDRAAEDIMQLTGSDVHGFTHILSADTICHINKRHGEKGKADNTIANVDHIGRMAYVLENYDYIEEGSQLAAGFKNSRNERAKTIVFVKRINGHVYTAEAVTDSQKSKALNITTMYLKRYVKNSAQKMESVIADHTTDLRPNVRNEADSVTSILPRPNKNVNSFDEKISGADEQRRENPRETYERVTAEREVAATRGTPSKPQKSGDEGNDKPPTKGK